jgi:hypothetical protein
MRGKIVRRASRSGRNDDPVTDEVAQTLYTIG